LRSLSFSAHQPAILKKDFLLIEHPSCVKQPSYENLWRDAGEDDL
jgi:hypothetical protein